MGKVVVWPALSRSSRSRFGREPEGRRRFAEYGDTRQTNASEGRGRWVPVRDNWVLASPEVVDVLVAHGVLQGPATA